MLQDKNGKITMSAWEREQYVTLTDGGTLPTTILEFEQGLISARNAHQKALEAGPKYPGDHEIMIKVINDHLRDPHEAQFRDYMRRWDAAGRPVGQAEHRAAGLL